MTFFHRAIHDMRTMEHAEVLFASLAETDAFVATLASVRAIRLRESLSRIAIAMVWC